MLVKTTSEMINLFVICIQEGAVLGTVKALLIDPKKRCVEYLVIDTGQWYQCARLLPFSSVIGIGKDALMIGTADEARVVSETEGAMVIAQKNTCIIGRSIYTNKGLFAGTVIDYQISEDDGQINGCLSDAREGFWIPKKSIAVFGRDVMIIEDSEEELPSEHHPIPETVLELIKTPKPEEEKPKILNQETDLEESEKRILIKEEEMKRLEEKQRVFLKNRKVGKRLEKESGEGLAEEGVDITDELIDQAIVNGKLITLTMNSIP